MLGVNMLLRNGTDVKCSVRASLAQRVNMDANAMDAVKN